MLTELEDTAHRGPLLVLGADETALKCGHELFPALVGVARNCVCHGSGIVVAGLNDHEQAIVALPLLIGAETFGYTRFQAVNAILAILGFFSLSVPGFNLLPMRPRDGAIAWGLLAAFFNRLRAKPAGRKPRWQSRR